MDPIRVLICDDEGQFVEPVVERLSLRGFDVEGVTNGHDALERLAKGKYDVVLLDVKMPGLGGLDVIKTIKTRWPKMQVVLLTGHGSKQDAEEGLEAGAYQYVMKPVQIDSLIEILQAAAKHK